ncbi:hypothetical protein ACIA8O_27435 [Kitasatospora sp. NPDC051853]|uniref:hypothetical protein n=1 Tax=Kitasatospora sp. NPDC051853 TaxID=3364058 RepID=UPI003791AECB
MRLTSAVTVLTAAVLLTAVGCTSDPAPAAGPSAGPNAAELVTKAADALRSGRSATVDFEAKKGNTSYTGTLSVDADGNCTGRFEKTGRPLGIGTVEVVRTPQGGWYRADRSVYETSSLERVWERHGDKYVTGDGAEGLFDGGGLCRSIGYFFNPEADLLNTEGAVLLGPRTVGGQEGVAVSLPGKVASSEGTVEVVVGKGEKPVLLQRTASADAVGNTFTFRDHGRPVTPAVPPAERTVDEHTLLVDAGIFKQG